MSERTVAADESLDLTPLESDIVFIVRDGQPALRRPEMDKGEPVPEEYLMLIGLMELWDEPGFRAMLIQTVHQHYARGELRDVIHASDERTH